MTRDNQWFGTAEKAFWPLPRSISTAPVWFYMECNITIDKKNPAKHNLDADVVKRPL